MKTKLRFAAVIAMTAALASGAEIGSGPYSGPFGLQRGMTAGQIEALVGHLKPSDANDCFDSAIVPRPHAAFESYLLCISPTQGLLKIIALGVDIRTNSFGDQIRSAFDLLETALTTAYGDSRGLKRLQEGSIWTDPQYWMMGLLKKEREHLAIWNGPSVTSKGIYAIVLEVKASSSEKAYIKLVYEFAGWNEYVDSKRAQAGKVF